MAKFSIDTKLGALMKEPRPQRYWRSVYQAYPKTGN